MKKNFIAVILIVLFICAGCSSINDTPSSTPDTAANSTDVVTEVPTEPSVDTEALFREMSGTYVCSAGTKGSTSLFLSTDGTFVGYEGYFETAVGDEEAPKGVYRYARFKGFLQNVIPENENQYYIDISELDYQTEDGTEEVKEGMRYQYTIADHIKDNGRFDIYTPEVKWSQVPDASLPWLKWNMSIPDDKEEPIGIYLLINKDNGEVFYQAIKKELAPPESQSDSDDTKEYYGENLLSMKVSNILDLMDQEITVDFTGDYYFVSSVGYVYFYNFDKLPGFIFYIRPEYRPNTPVDYFSEEDLVEIKDDILTGKYQELDSIAIINGAKLNNEVASDMTYNQISYARIDYNADVLAGSEAYATQDVSSTCDEGIIATVQYITPNEVLENSDEGHLKVSSLIEADPKVRCIIASAEKKHDAS